MDDTTDARPATSGTGTTGGTGLDEVIRASGLGFSYGGFTAVDGLDLTVRRGELYALLGTNGAGKTTTLEVLEGHRRPTAGTVEVLGGDPADRARTRPRVGIMLQDSGLAAELTVRESVLLSGAVSGREADVDALLDRVGIAAKARTRVAQLSGGEKRRVDFAMAVWGTPELVFLDEPTTGLDPSARDELWDVVRDLRDEGVTFLLTTHYLEEAERHADRIGLMHRGTLRREGTIADLTAGSTTSIRFVSPVAVAELPLPVSGTENGLVVVTTTDPQRDVAALLAWAAEHGHRLDRFGTHESGLDDVFRALSRDA
ncbi:ABC-2 type transport system ATP-binding protein [Frigoribacterium sp. PhB160]|uniref:ABC transporter ATP-binding protein n=1 Tax=Frigoribacterium sp. PhB160 TaxID=2485192 RepID=UPI000F470036|nr:ABC transporter ATP-binding protein [Frigoribacterium sp. PhB160]ROS61522.1 ABC-2 type transport system ATP-binding protein [Frigoribacterium sp. PhB160]